MARIARIAIPRYPYLVTQYGRDEGAIFFEPEERKLYCEYLRCYAEEFGLDIWAYCLLDNQVLLLVYPRRNSSLALAIGRAHMRFAAEINRATRLERTLLGRPFPLDPVGPKIRSGSRSLYRDGSHPGRIGQTRRFLSLVQRQSAHFRKTRSIARCQSPAPRGPEIGKWGSWLGESPDEKIQSDLSRNVKTGRPCGPLALLQKLEERLGLSLTPRKRGPKPKQPDPTRVRAK
jgi:putative transposase